MHYFYLTTMNVDESCSCWLLAESATTRLRGISIDS